MAISRQEVKSYREEYKCECCGKGELRFSGMVLTSYPARYEHRCNQCGERMYLDDAYPRVTQEVPKGTVVLDEDDGEIEGYIQR